MKKLSGLFILLSFLNIFCQDLNEANPEITSGEIKDHIYYLASDELKGRFSGSAELFQAAEYIKEEFENSSLQPLFGESFFQEFSFISGIEMKGRNSVALKLNEKTIDLRIEEDFIPAPFADSLVTEAPVVFAGYGISAPSLNYDDYKDLDVSNKIVLIMRYNPEYDNPHSQFEEYSTFRYKAATARNKGASGIIFVNGHFPRTDEDKLMDFRYDRGGIVRGISAVHFKRNFADELFKSQDLDFSSLQKRISENKIPSSFEFKNVIIKLKTSVREVLKTSWNVGGILKSSTYTEEYIVIGAHFDHLGMGTYGSLYGGDKPEIHNGADDNASGTTGLLELAEKFSSQQKDLRKNIIFLAFSGEELGLIGSSYFINHSPVPPDKIISMMNLDMIGRLNEKKELIVYGAGTSSVWKKLLQGKNKYDLKLALNDDGFGPSDHSSFYARQIPVLFFFTGTHPDYHKPSDDPDKINYEGEEKILKFVYDIAFEVNKTEDKPDYLLVPRKDTAEVTGWKVYVGTIPDYASTEEGFKISGVSEGSPAQKAGLKGGDIIIKFGNRRITNIYDYVYALKDHVPGEEVQAVALRNGEEMSFKIQLGAK